MTRTRHAALRRRAATGFMGLCVALHAAWSIAASETPFTLIVLPDTQNYAAWNPDVFVDQTQWIADNQEALNIVMVLHEGDLVGADVAEQWQVASDSMEILDQHAVPYAIVPGNHDYTEGRDLASYNMFFPLSRFTSIPTFGGTFGAEPASMANSYHTFRAASTDFLVLALEMGPRDAVLAWADLVIESHPTHRVIIVTHAYLSRDQARFSGGEPHNPKYYGLGADVNDGEDMWQELIRHHDTIDFVLCGHDGGGEGDGDPAFTLISQTDMGNPVYQIIANYQYASPSVPNEGALRIMTFDRSTRTVSVTTYSPTHDAFKTDPNSQFTLTEVGFFPSGPALTITDAATPEGATGAPTITFEVSLEPQ